MRGTVEDLFNFLDFIMLARTFKVDNLEQDRLEIENLKETIKSSKGEINSNNRNSLKVEGRAWKRRQSQPILLKSQKRALLLKWEEGADLQESPEEQRRKSVLSWVPKNT